MITRRVLLTGLLSTLAAPAIIRTPGLLMPVKRIVPILPQWRVLSDLDNDRLVDAFVKAMNKAMEDAILYGTGATRRDYGLCPYIPPSEWNLS